MDEPDLVWPAWRFGMKMSDLSTTLQNQYNTLPSSIQDPEAFHHDVFEISNKASTTAEFHSLMAERKEQRLRELQDSLEVASVEIIANPDLIGTSQWQYAVQLFRTRSLDSLVRYFSSYLPTDHKWRRTSRPDDTVNSPDTAVHKSLFFEDKPLHREAVAMETAIDSHLPPSPRSMTMCSDDSASDDLHHDYVLNNLTPARTLSFSESESERFAFKDSYHSHDESTFQSSDGESSVSSVSDISETHQKEFLSSISENVEEEAEAEDLDECFTQLPIDMTDETPTPKPDAPASCFLDAKASSFMLSTLRHRSLSPSRGLPLVHPTHTDCRKRTTPSRPRRLSSRHRDGSPAAAAAGGKGRRKSPGEPATRVQKPLPDPIRSRPRERRLRVDDQ